MKLQVKSAPVLAGLLVAAVLGLGAGHLISTDPETAVVASGTSATVPALEIGWP